METFKRGLACAVLALTPFSSISANAAYLYNNNDVISGGTADASILDNGPLGNSFSTGPGGYTLTAVDLLVLANDPGDGGSFTVSLLNDNSTQPGSTIATDTIADSTLSTSLSIVSAPFSSIALAANTRYWIELSTTTGSLEWSYSAINDGIGVGNEYNFYAGSVSANNSFTPYQMSIGTASAAPEPSTWALMLAGFGGLGFVRRYRRSRKTAALAA
ncbi:MAG TPA: choice-of-anchor R domain-containing protein [Roseiarcus sp.]